MGAVCILQQKQDGTQRQSSAQDTVQVCKACADEGLAVHTSASSQVCMKIIKLSEHGIRSMELAWN